MIRRVLLLCGGLLLVLGPFVLAFYPFGGHEPFITLWQAAIDRTTGTDHAMLVVRLCVTLLIVPLVGVLCVSRAFEKEK